MQVTPVAAVAANLHLGASQVIPTTPLTVDMLRTIYAPNGTQLRAKTRQTVTWEFGDWLLTNQYASFVGPINTWPAQTSLSVPGGEIAIPDDASPAETTVIINAALANGGNWKITKPGRYTVNGSQSPFSAIFIPSNTDFYIGPDVELFLESGSNVALMANSNAFDNGVVIGTGNMTHASGVITINQTDIGLAYPTVGQWITIDFVATKGYQGVFQIATTSPNTITFGNASGNLVSASPAVVMPVQAPFWNGTALVNQLLSMVIRPANHNIHVSGWGILDANGIGQTSSVSGDPRGLGFYLRGCANSVVTALNTRRARCWTIALNNTLNVHVRRIVGDNAIGGSGFGANANDLVHSTGENRGSVIEDIHAISILDNVVGSTLDYVDSGTGFLPYAWQTPGDNWDSTICRITARNTPAPVVTKWGNSLFRHGGTHIVDGIYATSSSSAFQILNYAPTSMLNCNGDVLKISNISGSYNDNPVVLSTNGAWDLIEVDNIRTVRVGSIQVQARVSPGGTPSVIGIKQLKVGKLFYTNAFEGANRTGPAVSIGGTVAGTAVVGYLDVSDVEEMPLAAGVPLVWLGSGATTLASVKRVALNNVAAVGQSGAGSLVQVSLASTVGEIVIGTACRYTGTGGTGHMVNIGAGVVAGTAVSFAPGSTAISAAGFITSAVTLSRLNGANAQFDPGAAGANITAPIPGDVFYNTNAAFGAPGVGVYMRGAAAWVRIAA